MYADCGNAECEVRIHSSPSQDSILMYAWGQLRVTHPRTGMFLGGGEIQRTARTIGEHEKLHTDRIRIKTRTLKRATHLQIVIIA